MQLGFYLYSSQADTVMGGLLDGTEQREVKVTDDATESPGGSCSVPITLGGAVGLGYSEVLPEQS